jgi:uncharacterized membrane protein YeiB
MLVLMNAPVMLAVIAFIFGLAPLLIGSNAVYILFTLCAGELLAQLAAKDVTQIVNSTVSLNIQVYSIVQIILLLIAPVIVLVLFKKSIKPPKRILQIIPAAASVVLCFMLIVNKLPYDMQKTFQDSSIYSLVSPYFEVAIAAGLLASLFYLWTKRPKHKLEEEKKPHK